MSVETYTCSNCGAQLGIAGENSGSEGDFAADDYYAQEVEYHRSGECASRVITPEPVEADPRAEFAAGLRAFADLIDANPDLPLPVQDKFEWTVWPSAVADVKAEIARIRRLLPGRFDKNDTSDYYNSKYFELRGQLRGLPLVISTYREQVCERVVVGTRAVTKTVPAPDAPMVEVTVTVEDVEWRCHPLLAEDVEPEAVSA
jgi:hypothetical protein